MWAKWICRRVKAKLWDYGAGELPEAEQRWMQAHIECCPVCKEGLAAVLDTISIVRSLRTGVVPNSETDFHDLIARLEVRQKRLTGAMPRIAASLVTVAAVGIIVCGLMIRRHSTNQGMAVGPEVVAQQVGADNGIADYLPGGGQRDIALPKLFPEWEASGSMKTAHVKPPSRNPLRLVRARYDRVKLYAAHGWSGRPHHLEHRLKMEAKAIYGNAVQQGAAVLTAAEVSGSDTQEHEEAMPRSFVMPVVGQSVEGTVRRAYVMGAIPMQAAGSAGAAAAEAQYPDAGRAL